jgi:hypothetical protein
LHLNDLLPYLQNKSPDPLAFYDLFSYPGQISEDPPLIKLAKHVLSICANSASCERLFSVFGNTLTKLRNRMSSKTLTDLAELKLLIRDEHRAAGKTKDQIKRKFGDVTPDAESAPIPSQPPPLVPDSTASTSTASLPPQHQDVTTVFQTPLTNSQSAPSSILQPGVPSNSEPSEEFITMMSQMAALADQDEDADDLPSLPSQVLRVPIRDLFNFHSTDWVEMYRCTAKGSLAEEVELYELVDRDSTAVDGSAVGLDPSTEAILAT